MVFPRSSFKQTMMGPESPMLHTKFQGNWPCGFGEDFWKVFSIYGHGGHLGHETWTIWTNVESTIARMLYMKFDWNWPRGFRGEVFWNSWRRRWQITVYTMLPKCLWLWWAKNVIFIIYEKYGVKSGFYSSFKNISAGPLFSCQKP